MKELRNICIIAHVDHGKTTLVDHLLRQAGTFSAHESVEERIMDSMDLERERGITIQAKNASIRLADGATINIVDTPGHADFGGEVERILGMVDGALLLVDGAEGPLPQTRFVLQKALQQGLRVIVVINKVDRPECKDLGRIHQVLNQIFDLFIDLGASELQADFPVFYAVARQGWCTKSLDDVPHLLSGEKKTNLFPLFDEILSVIPPPAVKDAGGFQMLVSNLGWSDYVGRLAIGRIVSGEVKLNQKIARKGVSGSNQPLTQGFNVSKLYQYSGMKQVEVSDIGPGDIAVVAGCEEMEIGDTLVGADSVVPLPRIKVEEPTLAMIFSVNTSPFSGKDGEAIQSRKLRERLLREVRQNVAIRFQETEVPDQFRVLGRGELQFGILIEQMRREGFEFMVGKPIVLTLTDENGQKAEPLEKATLDLPELHSGDVTRLFQERKGILVTFDKTSGNDSSESSSRVRLEFDIPTRGLLGIRSKYLTLTRGEGLFSSRVVGHTAWQGDMLHRQNGAMVADREGKVMEYALLNLEDRGVLFVKPGVMVYEGMIVGEYNKDNDLNVNPCKEKKLTNIRAAHAEVLVTLKGIREMSLERCIEWIDDDEWIEVTPKMIRLRKKILRGNMRGVTRGGD